MDREPSDDRMAGGEDRTPARSIGWRAPLRRNGCWAGTAPIPVSLAAIGFDLDYTLFADRDDARAGLLAAADRLAEETGLRAHDELLNRYSGGGRPRETFDRLLERHDLPDELGEVLVEGFNDARTPPHPRPVVERILSQLGAKLEVGLLSSDRGGWAKLHRLGLRPYFDAVLLTHPLGRSKADPAVFNRLLIALSVPPHRCMYVGDDPRVDFAVPNDLGMVTVRIRRGRYPDPDPTEPRASPDHEIDDIRELLGVIDDRADGRLRPH